MQRLGFRGAVGLFARDNTDGGGLAKLEDRLPQSFLQVPDNPVRNFRKSTSSQILDESNTLNQSSQLSARMHNLDVWYMGNFRLLEFLPACRKA